MVNISKTLSWNVAIGGCRRTDTGVSFAEGEIVEDSAILLPFRTKCIPPFPCLYPPMLSKYTYLVSQSRISRVCCPKLNIFFLPCCEELSKIHPNFTCLEPPMIFENYKNRNICETPIYQGTFPSVSSKSPEKQWSYSISNDWVRNVNFEIFFGSPNAPFFFFRFFWVNLRDHWARNRMPFTPLKSVQ